MTIYEHFDKFMLNRANELVRAWNWTTGRTKSDLASILGVGAYTAMAIGNYEMHNPICTVLTGFFALAAVSVTPVNKKIERLEVNAAEKGLKDQFAEKMKNHEKVWGPIMLGSSTLTLPGVMMDYSSSEYLCAGGLLCAASSYVMRADCLPPRKNVFSRAADKIRTAIQETQLQPQPIKVNYEGLENLT